MPSIKGFHPDTGEEITIVFKGNYPMKDPESNKFIFGTTSDGKKEPMFGDRQRARFVMLDKFGHYITDSRPMATAVMFSDHIPPEKKIRQMMNDAHLRAAFRAWQAEQQGVDTFDDFDFDDDLLDSVDGFISPHEMVDDPEIGKSVPRYLQGQFKAVKKAVQQGTGPLATTPPATPSSPAKEEPSVDGDT